MTSHFPFLLGNFSECIFTSGSHAVPTEALDT